MYGTVSIVSVWDIIYCVCMGQCIVSVWDSIYCKSMGQYLLCHYGAVSNVSVWASIYCDNVYHNIIHNGSIYLSDSKCLTESNSDSNNSGSNSL